VCEVNLTPLGFGIIVAILLVVTVIVVVAENIRDREDAAPEPVVRIKCDLESCGEPSVVEFAGGNGPLYICAKHAGPVSAWAPVVGLPYDQNEASA